MPKKKEEKDSSVPDQPELNIGLIGHVDHGKTTLTEKISGKWTDTHSEEIKRGITIRLGYADATFFKCPKCKGSEAYTIEKKCPKCKSDTKFVRKISLVDAPGHESLMATMLSGATIMDGAILLISATEECPQPQTMEHLMALDIIGVKNVIIVQNKIDLVSEKDAKKNYDQIKKFIKGTHYEKAPIIPLSALHAVNVDLLIDEIIKTIPIPKRDTSLNPIMIVARSFDINKPGIKFDKIVGGIVGGALKQGTLKVGEEIEIKPGYKIEEKNNQVSYKPLTTKIIGIKSGGTDLKEASPGGSIALMTSLDPTIVKSDNLVGSLVGYPGKLPEVRDKMQLKLYLLDRVVGAKDKLVVEPIKMNEPLMMNVNSAATVGFVTNMKKGVIDCTLKIPICADTGAPVTLSRRIGNRWRLIGYGTIE